MTMLKSVIIEIRDERHGYKDGLPPPLPPGAMPAQIGYGPAKINPEVWGTIGLIEYLETGDIEKIRVNEIKEKVKKRLEQKFSIGCAPGSTRPNDYLKEVLEGTDIPIRGEVGRCFGDWDWDYSDINPKVWKKALPTIKERLKKLYDKGSIRFAEWG